MKHLSIPHMATRVVTGAMLVTEIIVIFYLIITWFQAQTWQITLHGRLMCNVVMVFMFAILLLVCGFVYWVTKNQMMIQNQMEKKE